MTENDNNRAALAGNEVKSSSNSSFLQQFPVQIFFILFFLLWCVRLINLDQPILEGAVFRQTLTASVSRFLFLEGISLENFLFPKLYMAEYNVYYLIEMPIYNSITAFLSQIYGSHEEWIGRFISILFSGLAGVYFYFFLLNHTSERIAKIALLTYCVSPLSIIYTRAIQPNPLMLFFLITTIYYWDKYLKEPKWGTYLLTLFLGIILFLLNISMLTIGLLMLCLSLNHRGSKIFSSWKVYLLALLLLAPCWMWFIHANNFFQNNPGDKQIYIGILQQDMAPFLSLSRLFNYSFYKAQLQLLSGEVLTPPGFGLFIIGLGLLRKKDFILISWLASFAAYFLLINTQMHPYYYLPWLFPMAWVIATSISFIYDHIPPNSFYKNKAGQVFLFLFMAALIAGYSNSGFLNPHKLKYVPQAVKGLNRHYPSNEFGVISDSSGSALEYYVNRKVKVLERNRPVEKKRRFEGILEKGNPRFYLSLFPGEDYYNKNKFSDYLKENFQVAEVKKGGFILYTLK